MSHVDGVVLRPLDEELLEALLSAAVAGADPAEVMPPVPGPEGWTAERRAAFRQFHRTRSLSAAPVERTWAVVVAAPERVVGAARLAPLPDGAVEAGLWLARAHRGAGVGGAVLRRLVELARAAGAAALVAETTADNAAMRRILAGLGATATVRGGAVTARLPLNGRA
ncbi:GNAT family N-acetyltransferase [Streptomyces litchfieldiae]|uniref:GNAT family protein n=1 Tax=Streptomyces litchfieldiae TaxID=3075543 RepID=A0ABU2MWL6_9ACTN|nr:GNAT family protein [Streptomyces sp. DSM 44938]MDT0345233.1 GNAT family protein [Streptomyces sp. DSM 44938]